MLTLYNSLQKKVEEFHEITPEEVEMYTCGPTVYDRSHIGNLYSVIVADLIKRVLEAHGKKVTHVVNITDFGHLSGDEDGEDKMTKGLKREGLAPTQENMLALAEHYYRLFKKDLSLLNTHPSHFPHASKHVDEMVVYIEVLINKGFAYEIDDGVYFDVQKLDEYLVFASSGGGVETSHSRITETAKHSPRDFALWKKIKADSSTLGWESPWGKGFPGWHIECSAMSQKYLGDEFDIHTGGIDLEAIHHTNEVAQSKGAVGKNPARYWIHNAFLNVSGEKMAKSLGTGLTLYDLAKEGVHPLAFRYLTLESHYRTGVTYSADTISGAQDALQDLLFTFKSDRGAYETTAVGPVFEELLTLIDSNLDTPTALHKARYYAASDLQHERLEAYTFFEKVLGIDLLKLLKETELTEEQIMVLQKRDLARAEKNWPEADRLRDELFERGVRINDVGTASVALTSLSYVAKNLADKLQGKKN